jgi:glycerophosphoryl diester phosphodiesterase
MVGCLLLSLTAHAGSPTLDGKPPLVIGHRGACGYRPEHTIASYELAVEMGADFIEPDLVMSKDGELVVRHGPRLGSTTDVSRHPEFADRKTTKSISGETADDWYVEDFTLAELKTLRAVQDRTTRPQEFNGKFQIVTLDEVISLAKQLSEKTGRDIGIYPETKCPTYYKQFAEEHHLQRMEDKLLEKLHAAYGNHANAPVLIQSFEVSNLQYLHEKTKIKLVQLVDGNHLRPDGTLDSDARTIRPFDFTASGDQRTWNDLLTPEGLKFIRGYADGISPCKPYLLRTRIYDPDGDGKPDDRDRDGVVNASDREVAGDTGLISRAHKAGLFVHSWTFRKDGEMYGFTTLEEELKAYFDLGIDGVFTDFPDIGIRALGKTAR